MFDEETGAEPKIVSASIGDPFLLLVRDDASIYVARCDEDNELEELEREDEALLATKWLSGCLYTDTKGVFAKEQNDKGSKVGEDIMMFLLSAGGALYVSVPKSSLKTANSCRFMRSLICQSQFTLLKGSVLSPQRLLLTTQQEGQGQKKP